VMDDTHDPALTSILCRTWGTCNRT
jgi:hypothetical protein